MENNLNGKKKIRLEDLDKKNIHSVPKAYFDKLPYSIQEKIHQKESSWFEKLKLSPVKYTIPALAILIGLFLYIFFKPSPEQIAQNKKQHLKSNETVDVIKQKEEFNNKANPPENKIEKEEDLKITSPGSIDIHVQEENKNGMDISKTDEIHKTVEQYLAGVSKEDIRTYLVVHDLDESQMEEIIIEN